MNDQQTKPASATPLIANSTRMSSTDRDKLNVYRVVVGCLLVSLVWKFRYFPLFFTVYRAVPLQDDFFPAAMRSPEFLATLYLLPIVLGVLVMFLSHRLILICQSSITCLAMFGMCVHQQSYNDVTFVTCFWTSVWCLWYVVRFNDPAGELFAKAGSLSVLIISVIFLGGVLGKLTPGYWSGEVMYQIYFADRDFWIFNILRATFDGETVRAMATYYSRMVIGVEFLCAFLWLLPTRWACLSAIAVTLSITFFSNIYLLSVMCCLFGLAIAGLHRPKSKPIQLEKSIFQCPSTAKLATR